MIEVVEVGNNDRHRERDRQHAGNGTQGPYYFSPHTYWPVDQLNNVGTIISRQLQNESRSMKGIFKCDF